MVDAQDEAHGRAVMESTEVRMQAPMTEVEQIAQRLYARTLSQWAMDLMALRRDGLHVPSHRGGDEDFATPSWNGAVSDGQRWAGIDARRNLRWRPVRKAA